MKKFQLLLLALAMVVTVSAQDQLDNARKKIKAGDYAGAKADLTKVIEGNAKNKLALNLRGEARLGLQDFYGAIGDFTNALENDSTYADAYNNRGEAKMALGDDEGSIEDF